MDKNKEQAKNYMKLMAKCWSDEAFKKSLMKDPVKIFKENGVEFPAGIKLHVVENSEKEAYIIIPPKPSDELSDEQLDKVAGGFCGVTVACGSPGTFGCTFTTGKR